MTLYEDIYTCIFDYWLEKNMYICTFGGLATFEGSLRSELYGKVSFRIRSVVKTCHMRQIFDNIPSSFDQNLSF